MYQTNFKKKKRKEIVITKKELEGYLYYLLYRIDSVYYNELKISIDNFIASHEVEYE